MTAADTIHIFEKVRNAIVAKLQTITQANGYNLTVQKVQKPFVDPSEKNIMPLICVEMRPERPDFLPCSQEMATVHYTIYGYTKSSKDWTTIGTKLATDMQTAMCADCTFGMTEVANSFAFQTGTTDDDDRGWSTSILEVEAKLIYPYGQPGVAA